MTSDHCAGRSIAVGRQDPPGEEDGQKDGEAAEELHEQAGERCQQPGETAGSERDRPGQPDPAAVAELGES